MAWAKPCRRNTSLTSSPTSHPTPFRFARPFTITFAQRLRPETELLENFCAENELDAPQIVGK
jgi:hypothetical protein